MKFSLSTIFSLILAFSINAQSSNNIGLDLIGTNDDNFKIGLRYEHKFAKKHGLKLGLSYNGVSGLTPTVGYQYFAVNRDKFKLVTGLDYTFDSSSRLAENDALVASHLFALPIDARFKIAKSMWLNIGLSPTYNMHNTTDKISLTDFRVGALFSF